MEQLNSPSNSLNKCLLNKFEISWQLLDFHLNNLSIEECIWKPTENRVFLKKVDEQKYKGEFPETEGYEINVPNIAWLTWHINF